MNLEDAYRVVLNDLRKVEEDTRTEAENCFLKFDLFKDLDFRRDAIHLSDYADNLRIACFAVSRLMKSRGWE